ncbi:helix-turn-helix domain-containing protein [Kitasatospora sp. SC0581]|uniref:AraC family transcriptional regulator n=1 Tax=Kitasatospora sp. SC0581 TaxID=3394360 RepID=UPI003A8B9204
MDGQACGEECPVSGPDPDGRGVPFDRPDPARADPARPGAGGGPAAGAAGAGAPRFAVGPGYALYQGPLADSGFHRHATFQVAVAAAARTVAIDDDTGRRHRGPALVVAPMVRHRMAPTREVLTFYVDPHCAFADRLRAGCAPGVAVAPQWRGLTERDVRPGGGLPATGLDPRLRAAMAALAADGREPLEGLAARVGLSPQRLRALARRQLGVPLARWRSWQRLSRAALALGEGCSLAQAALAGGFADQAHLTRWMRELTGLTPSQVLPALRGTAVQAGRRAV